jgi:hypothetical protein
MIPPAAAPDFLAAHGWAGARIEPLAGDASFRRYFRIRDGARRAVLMDAPPEHEDVRPFLAIARHLCGLGLSAPRDLAVDMAQGLLLLEDFGDDRVGPVLARDAALEHDIYAAAIDILVELGQRPVPSLPPYDATVLEREVLLLPEWYGPATGLDLDAGSWLAAWNAAWGAVVAETMAAPVLVLRDYHADNLMLLPQRDGLRGLGLLDFQDALAGHRAYDLVSLLQDARRDVSPELEAAMLDRYVRAAGITEGQAFRAAYEVLGAQRNSKILGIFTRLWKRDGKGHYRAFQPRVWGYLERNLGHPALAPVRQWFDAHVPQAARAGFWREHAA